MKTIGLLGGTSWPSTPEYYEYLNRKVAEREGGYHSAKIILYSIDYHAMKALYGQANAWEKENIPGLLASELKRLASMSPDMILICNNTLHKAYDVIKDDLSIDIPVIHIVDSAGEYATERGLKNVLLLGTKFSMEDGFFARKLVKDHGLSVGIPDEADRDRIQVIQTAVSSGKTDPGYRAEFKDIIGKYPKYDAVILACTELPLVVSQEDYKVPIINTINVQCDAALKYAFS